RARGPATGRVLHARSPACSRLLSWKPRPAGNGRTPRAWRPSCMDPSSGGAPFRADGRVRPARAPPVGQTGAAAMHEGPGWIANKEALDLRAFVESAGLT